MTREEAIKQLRLLKGDITFGIASKVENKNQIEALSIAIASLETDEAYQLEYESTTKDNLGVDAISRKALLDATVKKNSVWNKITNSEGDNLETIIAKLPSVTSHPRKGHWIENAEEYYKAINEKGGGINEDTDYFVDDIACSECLAKFSVIDNEAERFDFCPCCGSDNREVVEE